MTIRRRLVMTTGIVLLAMIAVLYAISRSSLLNQFIQIEKNYAQRDINRVVNATSEELNDLDIAALKYSHDNDVAEFIDHQNPRYVRNDMSDEMLKASKVDIVAFVNNSGKPIFVKTLNGNRRSKHRLPRVFGRYLRSGSPLLKHENPACRIKGVMMIGSWPAQIVSRPVISESQDDNVIGTVIVGRYLSRQRIADIGRFTGLDVTISPNHLERPRDSGAPLERLVNRSPVTSVHYVSNDLLRVSAQMFDLHGKPAVVMDVQRPRTVYRQLRTSIAYLFSSLVMVGLLFGLVLWMELDSLLFARLSVLSRSVAMIGKRGNMAARIVLPGRDELSMLANAMNGMLDDLEASQAELRMQEALRESEERYRSLVEVCPDAVIIVSRDSCVFANAAAARLLGYKLAADLVHKNISDFLQPACLARLGEQISKLADGTETVLRFEGKIICLDGSPADAEIAGTVFEYHNEPALQLVIRDVTDKNNHQRQLNHMAHHDHLTGLPNRLLFSDRLSQRLADSRRYNHVTAVMFIDLDRFKFVNDTMGHNIGDMLLREVSARLSTCLRDVDTIARMGGDEFTIILSDIHSVESVTHVARRALDVMAEKFVYDGREVYISGSMGISLYPNDGLDAETLVRNADAAMYRAKEYGGNNYQMYTQELNSVIMEKMKVETDLRKAIEREEFLMYYQPRVDLQTSRVRGMEALIRWKHPSLGIVSPARFIPAAEETGLIIPLSDWVLRTVCAQNKAWQDSGLPCVSVAVNISARHFHHHGDLVGSVKAALDESGLDPQYLEIEVTEHVVLQDIDQAITVLNELRAMGVRISIDDFGTGYSSLTHLKTLPLNMIKIDRSFIKEITTNSDDAAIAGAVVAMAHSLNLRVIAEGVETLEQLHLLRSLECDEMQGYFVSRPVPPEDFARFLQNVDQESQSGIYAA